jgi:hypothetical protein
MVASNIADVAFAIQSAKGSPASASTNRLWLAGGTQPHSNSVNEDFEETSGIRMLSDSYVSSVGVEGAPEFFVMPESIAPLLYGVLGAQAISGASDPYTHTLTPGASLPYFTFWRMLANGLFEKMSDCIITALAIHGESGKPLRVTPTIMGLAPTFLTAAEATVAVEKTNRFMHYDASAAYKVEGTAVSCVRSFDLTIDNGSEVIPGDSLEACDVSVGRLTVSAATTQLVSDFALWNRLHYGGASPSNAAVHTQTVLELAGSPAGLDWLWTRVAASRTLEILVPRVQVEPFDDEPDVSGNPMVRTVTYTAKQPASGAAITAVIKNAKATTY